MSIPGESYAKDELNESWWGGATTAATLCLRDRAPNVDPRALLLYNLNFQGYTCRLCTVWFTEETSH